MVITIYRSASQRSRATRISRRARAQECIGAHGGRKAKLPPRSKKSQNFARGGLAKGLGHAFRGMQVVGISTNRIGSKTNCPLGNAIFMIAILAIKQSGDLKMRIRKWIFRLPADPHARQPPRRGRRREDCVRADARTRSSDPGCGGVRCVPLSPKRRAEFGCPLKGNEIAGPRPSWSTS